jgi:hypothetical protein
MHPDYTNKPTKGGRTTKRVVDAFVADSEGMHQVAQALWENGDLARPETDFLEEQEGQSEGGTTNEFAKAVEGP